jgi:hypothetical protein
LAASSVGLDLTVDLSIVEMERFAISDQAWRSETLAEEDLERERERERERGVGRKKRVNEKKKLWAGNCAFIKQIKHIELE